VSPRGALVDGAVDVAPASLSLGSIGVVVGITAVQVGLTSPQAVWMSLTVYNGLTQAAMLGLMGSHAPAVVVAVAGALVNLRLVMYSASLAPHVERLSLRERVPAAYLLVDVVYAVSIVAFETGRTDEPVPYYLGAAITTWCCWQVGTVLGLSAGTVVPPGLHLEFAIPLLFVALLVPLLDERPSLVAAGVGGVVAVLAAGLPFDAGLVVGTGLGVGAGLLAERWWSS